MQLRLPTNGFKLPSAASIKRGMMGQLGKALGLSGGPAGTMTGGKPQSVYRQSLPMPMGMKQVLRKGR
jgi:hypothetical protein